MLIPMSILDFVICELEDHISLRKVVYPSSLYIWYYI